MLAMTEGSDFVAEDVEVCFVSSFDHNGNNLEGVGYWRCLETKVQGTGFCLRGQGVNTPVNDLLCEHLMRHLVVPGSKDAQGNRVVSDIRQASIHAPTIHLNSGLLSWLRSPFRVLRNRLLERTLLKMFQDMHYDTTYGGETEVCATGHPVAAGVWGV
jgi:hypothetical protein